MGQDMQSHYWLVIITSIIAKSRCGHAHFHNRDVTCYSVLYFVRTKASFSHSCFLFTPLVEVLLKAASSPAGPDTVDPVSPDGLLARWKCLSPGKEKRPTGTVLGAYHEQMDGCSS